MDTMKASQEMMEAWAARQSARTGLAPWREAAVEVIEAAKQIGVEVPLNATVKAAIMREQIAREVPKQPETPVAPVSNVVPVQPATPLLKSDKPKTRGIKSVYVIGALKCERVIEAADYLRSCGYEVFDDWYSPGPETDQYWQEYEQERGRSFIEALDGYHAWHVFNFDRTHLHRCDAVVLVLPCGKSGHLEFGYVKGLGKPGFIFLDKEPERWDVMYRFADKVVGTFGDLEDALSDITMFDHAL